MKAAVEDGLGSSKEANSEDYDDVNGMHRLVSAEASMRGVALTLWVVTLTEIAVLVVAQHSKEVAAVLAVMLFFTYSVMASLAWWMYYDKMTKRLKNHSV
jgi:hypothetical protein